MVTLWYPLTPDCLDTFPRKLQYLQDLYDSIHMPLGTRLKPQGQKIDRWLPWLEVVNIETQENCHIIEMFHDYVGVCGNCI